MASIEIDAYHAANLSAAEAAILLIGPKVGDEVTLSLSVKELVARGYLSMAFADRKRRFLPRKRVALLVSGSNSETPVDPLLNAVLNTFRSARLLDRVSIQALIEQEAARKTAHSGDRPRFPAMSMLSEISSTPIAETIDGDVTGVSVSGLASAVFMRNRDTGWINWKTHGLAKRILIPSLLARGYCHADGSLTEEGKASRSELENRLNSHQELSGNQCIVDELRKQMAGTEDIDVIFAAIDQGVSVGWHLAYGD